jgi:hypothetical protein
VRGSRVDIDEARARAQIERAAKRLYAHAENILITEQETLRERIVTHAPEASGQLRRHVYVDVVRSARGPVLKGGVRDLPYAVYVEFGSTHGGTYIPPQPFLRPAIQEMGGFIRSRRKVRA